MRLHLLQAVVLYHQNKREESLSMLRNVDLELRGLKVDPDSITALVELGKCWFLVVFRSKLT